MKTCRIRFSGECILIGHGRLFATVTAVLRKQTTISRGYSSKTLRVPTLVLGGAHDPIFPASYLEQYVVSPIHGSRLVLLPCGHEIPIELPREAAGLLEAFLAGLQ